MNHLSFLKYCKTKFFAEKIASAFKGPLTKLRFEEFILLRSFRSILYESKAHKFCPKYLNCFLGLQTLKTFRTGYQITIAVVDQVLSQSSRFLLPNWNILLWHFIVCTFIFQIAISRQFSLQFLFKFLVSLRLSGWGRWEIKSTLSSSRRQFIQFPASWLVSRTFSWFSWESATWSQNENKIVTLSDKL